MTNKIHVIFDNGGGITLQITSDTGYTYQHSYEDASQCADDIKAALNGANPADWDGNETDGTIDDSFVIASDDQIRNGGYKEREIENIHSLDDLSSSGWRNARDLSLALSN